MNTLSDGNKTSLFVCVFNTIWTQIVIMEQAFCLHQLLQQIMD